MRLDSRAWASGATSLKVWPVSTETTRRSLKPTQWQKMIRELSYRLCVPKGDFSRPVRYADDSINETLALGTRPVFGLGAM